MVLHAAQPAANGHSARLDGDRRRPVLRRRALAGPPGPDPIPAKAGTAWRATRFESPPPQNRSPRTKFPPPAPFPIMGLADNQLHPPLEGRIFGNPQAGL